MESHSLAAEPLMFSLLPRKARVLRPGSKVLAWCAGTARKRARLGHPLQDAQAGPKLIGQPLKGKRFDVQKKSQLAAGLQVLCRTCTPLLHIKAPSFWGPAVAAKQTEVSGWVRRRRIPLLRPFGPDSVSSLQLTSAPWAAPSRGRSLLLSQLHVFV